MAISRIFINKTIILHEEIRIEDKTFHYLINVMRRKTGDKIFLVNGFDGEFMGDINFVGKKYLTIIVSEKTREFCSNNFLGLIFAPIQKMDILLKSATEIGVSEFTPITTEYSNTKINNENKLEANIIEALEQSERLDMPKINKIQKLEKVLEILNNDDNIIFFCEERTANNTAVGIYNNMRDKILNKKIYALVGAEGGFSEREKNMIKQYKNVISITLGSNVLRTETAVVSILSILKNFFIK